MKCNIVWGVLIGVIALLGACGETVPTYTEQLDRRTPMDSSFRFPGYVVNDARLNEVSGLVASRRNRGYLWAHNDSGDKSRIFLIDTLGRFIAQYTFPDLKFRDLEDIAAATDTLTGKSYLYLADIGDNRGVYGYKYIYRFEEPAYRGQGGKITRIDKITLQYPDGNRDAEALMIDPQSRDLYVISKREDSVGVYRAAYPHSTTQPILLEKIAVLPFSLANAADISVDGREILIKNYVNIYYWRRAAGESIAQTFRRAPKRVPYLYEPQGESIAWATDGSGYYTMSEEAHESQAMLFFFERKKNKPSPQISQPSEGE